MRDASQTTVEALRSDKKFRLEYLKDALSTLFTTESRVALLMFRDIINASIGFKILAAKVGTSDKTLMGMLTEGGNPTLNNISKIIEALIEHEEMVLDEVRLRKA